jgi:hypothetical protein
MTGKNKANLQAVGFRLEAGGRRGRCARQSQIVDGGALLDDGVGQKAGDRQRYGIPTADRVYLRLHRLCGIAGGVGRKVTIVQQIVTLLDFGTGRQVL